MIGAENRKTAVATIKIEDFDPQIHPNPMWYVDDEQAKRQGRVGRLVPYKVCSVEVCGFQFLFHSVVQIDLCLDYYRREHHPSSRLPVYTENLGGDHYETQRWFEKLPQYLLESSKRAKVVAALERARSEYEQHEGASTKTAKPSLYKW
jgi:hypothetical protein